MLRLDDYRRIVKPYFPDLNIAVFDQTMPAQGVLDYLRETYPGLAPRRAAMLARNFLSATEDHQSPAFGINVQVDGTLVSIIAVDEARLNNPQSYGFHLIRPGLPPEAIPLLTVFHEAGHLGLDKTLQRFLRTPEDGESDSLDAREAFLNARAQKNLHDNFGISLSAEEFPRLQEGVCDLFGSAAAAEELGLPHGDFTQRVADTRAIHLASNIQQGRGGQTALDYHVAPLLDRAGEGSSISSAAKENVFPMAFDCAVKILRADKNLLGFPGRDIVDNFLNDTLDLSQGDPRVLAANLLHLKTMFDRYSEAARRGVQREEPTRGAAIYSGNSVSGREFT